MTVEYESTADGTIEVICEGAQIAGLEPGGHDENSSFSSDSPGFTVSYGRGFGKSKWFATIEAAKAWLERKAADLLDY